MNLEDVFADKSIKNKAKVAHISEWFLDESLPMNEVLAFTSKQNSIVKASCIEAIELSSKTKPNLVDEEIILFVINSLSDDEPRVKWESAKVISNVAHLFPEHLKSAVSNLLQNTSSDGTVVRWATASALGEILKLKTTHNSTLLPKIESLASAEKNNGVKKKYLNALKKVNK